MRGTTNGIIALTLGGQVAKANDATQRILSLLGVGPAERDQSIQDVLPELQKWLPSSLERALKNPDGDRVIEHEIRKGRRSITANIGVTAMRDRRGEAIGYVIGLEDVSLPRRLATMLYRYMGKPVADALIDREPHLLGGALRPVSIMFADIRGFTAMSETAGAKATVALLNEYFEEVVRAVFKHHGVLDKYIGDAIMAVFGVPFAGSRDPQQCISAAVAMVRGLAMLNSRRNKRGAAPIQIGIGIETGEAVVGNIGCSRRMDFTVIGDSVNVASRLEGANKTYGTTILVSENTASAVAGRGILREVDLVRLHGKQTAIRLFEVLVGWSHAERAALGEYEEGLAAYRTRNWKVAQAHFRAALAARPGDGPSTTMLRRSRAFEKDPPHANWNGVWNMASK